MKTSFQPLLKVCVFIFIFLFQIQVSNSSPNMPKKLPKDWMEKGLVGHWKFDEGRGTTTKDYSRMHNDGTIHGAVWTIDGKHGTALYFDGIEDYVEIDPHFSLNLTDNFTVSAWFKCEGNEGGLLVSKGFYCCPQYRTWAFSMQAEFNTAAPALKLGIHYSTDGNNMLATDVRHETQEFWNVWHHAVMVFQNGEVKLYDNGQKIGVSDINSTLLNNDYGIRIGRDECTQIDHSLRFNGFIDEIRIYNRPLSDEEVLLLYNSDMYNEGRPIFDSRPPSIPKQFYWTNSEFSNRIDLKWLASKDNIAVKGYHIYRKSFPVGIPKIIGTIPASGNSSEIFSDVVNVSPKAKYSYTVVAFDVQNNKSRMSKPVVIKTSGSEILPVFPNAQGFGVATPAGRGGKILRVTNLNPDGEGSLKAAIDSVGPRVIVFEVSGTIDFPYTYGHLTIWNPYLTIAGQTAPSPGITITNAVVRVFTHDVLIQHLRIRLGDLDNHLDPTSLDGLTIGKAPSVQDDVGNIVIDHCSISWALDENVDIGYNGTHDITISNCIISEGLFDSKHPVGPHSKGLIVGDSTRNISVIRNLFVHNDQRNPSMYGFSSSVIVNNLVYNPGFYGMAVNRGNQAGGTTTAIVGNVVIPGHDSDYANRAIKIDYYAEDHSNIHVFDNWCELKTDYPWSSVLNFKGSWIKSDLPLVWVAPLTVLPSEQVKEWVLNHAGARPADRDAVDLRIINNVLNGDGNIINSQEDVDGWPQLDQNNVTLAIPANPEGDDDGDGYTNLEEWLYDYAKLVENENL